MFGYEARDQVSENQELPVEGEKKQATNEPTRIRIVFLISDKNNSKKRKQNEQTNGS